MTALLAQLVGTWRWLRSGIASAKRNLTNSTKYLCRYRQSHSCCNCESIKLTGTTAANTDCCCNIPDSGASAISQNQSGDTAVIMDRKFINVILMGFGFMFVFTAFQTMGIIEQTVINSIKEEWDREGKEFTGDGYTSLAIVYLVFSFANWIAPSVIAVIGAKFSLIAGAFIYALFIASFLYPMTWLLYLCSVLLGVGAAIIWTAQGNYLTVNSDDETMSRNSGIFWAQLQCSLLFGNLFCFFKFSGSTTIDKQTREVVFSVFLVTCVIGIVFMAVLQKVPRSTTERPTTPLIAFKNAIKLFLTKDMALLSVTFLYTGFELTFFSGVYSTCIGFTQSFGDVATSLVGLSGMFIGVGEIIGGASFGIFGKKTIKYGRDPIVILGFLVHMTAFYLIFLNMPEKSPLGKTADEAFIHSNQYLALFCSFLLGFGDSCFNTQIYSLLGVVYSNNSVPAFALFKFTQSLSAAACFFYSRYVNLYYQLLILVVFLVLGTLSFCIVEWKSYVHKAAVRPNSDFDTSCVNRHGDNDIS